ncbi:MAG: DnaJ domain-containing protein [Alphaproteobacteria bacterium]
MLYLLAGFGAVVFVWWIIHLFLNTEPSAVVRGLRIGIAIFLALIFIGLLISGRLNWLFSILLPIFIPIFISAWQGSRNKQGVDAPPSTKNMTLDQAYEILGLKPGASKEDVIAAYHKLMKKNHPDTGGSTYIARQLTDAKDLILASL